MQAGVVSVANDGEQRARRLAGPSRKDGLSMAEELAKGVGTVEAAVEGGIATVVLSQPERRNAMSLAMWDQLGEIVRQLDADSGVRVTILRGAGTTAFSAGADISEFEQQRSTPEQALAYNRRVAGTAEALIHFRKPLLAMVYGFCVGGGLEMALACDLRIASDQAVFGIPAARLGISYGHEDIKRLVDLVGPANARYTFFTGDPRIPAERALRMGLVDEIVPTERLAARVGELAAQIADNAPSSLLWAKRGIEDVLRDPSLAGVLNSDEEAAQLFGTADFKEGVAAFLEKRKPRFNWDGV
jgi:enoyl-CoA hydratase/carnithine racemase